MAESAYEYECMRAELLGAPKPEPGAFLQIAPQNEQIKEHEVEESSQVKDEHLERIAGGLDETNSILQVTQRKISKFKASCGSLTNLLKIKLGHGSGESLDSPEQPEPVVATNTNNQLDKLDAMLNRAENAQFSLVHQNKEMRKFLN